MEAEKEAAEDNGEEGAKHGVAIFIRCNHPLRFYYSALKGEYLSEISHMHLPLTIFYHPADKLEHQSYGYLLSPRGTCRPWGERRPPERYPEKLDRSKWVAYAVAFLFELFQVGIAARDLMRESTSAKSSPGTATSAI